MKLPLIVIAAAVISCGARESQLASLRIQRLDAGAPAGRELNVRVDPENRDVTKLAQTLERCSRREVVKFLPVLRVVATRRDGRPDVTFLVHGKYVKVDGVAYRCPDDVEALVDRAWPASPQQGDR